jgi:hypothetical protein
LTPRDRTSIRAIFGHPPTQEPSSIRTLGLCVDSRQPHRQAFALHRGNSGPCSPGPQAAIDYRLAAAGFTSSERVHKGWAPLKQSRSRPTAPQRDSFKAVHLRKRVFCSMLPNTLLHTLVQNSVVSKRESARMFRLKAIWSNLDGETWLGHIRWIHAMPAAFGLRAVGFPCACRTDRTSADHCHRFRGAACVPNNGVFLRRPEEALVAGRAGRNRWIRYGCEGHDGGGHAITTGGRANRLRTQAGGSGGAHRRASEQDRRPRADACH